MTVQEALGEMEYRIGQRHSAIALLRTLGKVLQQDVVIVPNLDETILGICELLSYLLEKDETALGNAMLAACTETTFSQAPEAV